MAHGRDNETRYLTVSQHCWDLLVVTTQGSLSLGKSLTVAVTTCNKGRLYFTTNIIFSDNLLSDIKAHVNGIIEQIVGAYANEPIDEVIAIGHEIQPVATTLAKDEEPLMKADRKTLSRLAKQLSVSKEKQLAETYEVNVYATRPLLAGVVCNLEVAGKFGLSALHVPTGRFEERFLTGLAGSDFAAKRFVHEVIGSAKALARKYAVDKDHGRHVAALAVKLFDELVELTALSPQDRLLLEVAGIVHEVGGFISRRSHHKHSFYIIKNSEIFGLNDEESSEKWPARQPAAGTGPGSRVAGTGPG